jgi:DNA-binding FadR family transcriptional regulator
VNNITGKESLSYEISLKIKELIISKKLNPGDKLPNETELCEIMNVSRPTIREAIKFLTSNNIVEVLRGKGTFVSKNPGMINDPLGVDFINSKNILQYLFEARMVIEPGVAKIAAKSATKEDLERIEKYIDEMKNVANSKKNYSNNDLKFHIAIAKATKNPIIQRIVPIIHEAIIKSYKETSEDEDSVKRAIEAHRKIYQAIKAQDCELAEKCMIEHLKEALKDANH